MSMRIGSSRWRAAALIAMLTLVAMAFWALANGSGGTAAGASTSAATLRELSAKLERAKQAPKFSHPGPRIDVSSLKGKTIYVIPYSMTGSDFNGITTRAARDAAKVAGVKVKVYNTTGVPSQWTQGMERAIAEKPIAIILQGPPPELLAPQIRRAKAAGIPVIGSHVTDHSRENLLVKKVPGLTIGPRAPFQSSTRLLADYIITQSKGKAVVAYVAQDDMAAEIKYINNSFYDEIAKKCPGCKLVKVSASFADQATKTTPAVLSLMRQHPDVNWIASGFDNLVPYIEAGLRQSGKSGVKIATFNGTPSALKLIKRSGPTVMNVGEPLFLTGWTGVDQAMRLALKKKPVKEPDPVRLFDASNVAEAGTPPKATSGYGPTKQWRDGFAKLWMKK